MKTQTSGQTLTEFAFLASITAAILSLAAMLLYRHWERSACAYLVFEATHARRASRPEPKSNIPIRVTEDSHSFYGEGVCGKWREKVQLPKLESAQW